MKFRRKVREPLELNLAPLIDVVFILLLFFVVTTTFTRETQMRVDLPEAVSGTPPEAHKVMPVEISVMADSQFAVNGQLLVKHDLQTLMAALQRESKGDSSVPVIISSDALAPYQAVITAMDAAGKLGFSRLQMATVEAQAAP